jgi:hypothetical protein
MMHQFRIALAATLLALATVSATVSASARPRFTDITDGTSQTLMIGEHGGQRNPARLGFPQRPLSSGHVDKF